MKLISKYLTTKDIHILTGKSLSTIRRWTNQGVRKRIGFGKFSPVYKLKFEMVNVGDNQTKTFSPKDLQLFFKQVGLEEYIVDIPKFMRS